MNFGLTVTQAKLYLLLCLTGKSDAKTIAKLSGLARQDVYRVLDELFSLGLIERIATHPTEFAALSIPESLKLLSRRRKEENEKLEKEAEIAFRDFEKKRTKEEVETLQKLVVVSEKQPVIIKTEDLLEGVQKTLTVISPRQKLLPWLFEHSELFEKALERNIKMRLITDKPKVMEVSLPPFVKKFEKTKKLNIKFLSKPPRVSFGIYDSKRIIFELSATTGYLMSETVFSDNSCLIELASTYFKLMWSKARDSP